MGHDSDDGSIKQKIGILANSLKTDESKCTFINFLTGYLPQKEKPARGQDVKSLKEMATLAKNFDSPKLKCLYADVIAFLHSQNQRKRPANTNTDDEKLESAKKRKLQDTESLWQCDECGKKLSNKASLKRHSSIHTKKPNPQKQCDVKAKANTRKSTTAEKKLTNTPKKTEDQKVTVKSDSNFKCAFCNMLCKAEDIYKHYGLEHNIDCPEEILFFHGNVLVTSDRDTEGGEAAWFKAQKKKSIENYKSGMCKFCDGLVLDDSMLKHHYTTDKSLCGHNVDPSCLEAIKYLFRAEKTAHMSHITGQNTPKIPRKNNRNIPRKRVQDVKDKSDVKADIKAQISKPRDSVLLMYVCECGVATEKYDCAVEHSQRHLVDCTAVTQTCEKCEFAFEPACYADHIARHTANDITHDDFIQVKYDFTKLQSPDWFDMFKDVSQINKDQIMNSSIYKYTRNVKLNADSIAGVPVYQCAKCQQCIDPKKVEHHCNNGNICVKYKRRGYICPKCNLTFQSDNVLKAHKEDHKIGPMRIIMFSHEDDYSFNRALLKLEHIRTSSEENLQTPKKVTSASVEENVQKSKINVISDTPVVVNRLCNKCNTYVNVNEFKTHSAIHDEEEKLRSERVLNQEASLINNEHDDHQNEVTENVVHSDERDANHENNRQQESDSDSCLSVVHSVVVAKALIHEGERHQKSALAKDISENAVHTSNHVETIDKTPEQLMANLYGDIGSSQVDIDDETQCTQDLLAALGENDTLEHKSVDMFTDDIIQNDMINLSDARNGLNRAESDTTIDTNYTNGNQEGRKLSTKDRLRVMLPEDDSLEDFEELNAKISQLIWSRD